MANKPKQKTIESPDKYLGQMGILYTPFVPYENFYSTDAATWRYISRKQPFVMDCITTIVMKIQALPWAIRAKDANKADELRGKIDAHKKIFLEFGGIGYLNAIDLLLNDYYMTPFGGAVEPVQYSDGRLYKLSQPIDSATLFPTTNPDFPVVQRFGTNEPIVYRADEIIRLYSPRPEIERRGWGYATVEKVYLAVELLARGDRYYAQLLLDTPEAGLLDLGDMSKESAEKWLESFRNVMTGIDPFKIPVIYQHNVEAKFIPFGRPPTDLLFDQVTFKYAQLVCAAFGLTTGDIGVKASSGASLSGQIRDERHSRSTGYASIKAKLVEIFNRALPDDLEFMFVDTDDELLVSKGRARSANAVAGRNLIEAGALTPKEWRKQLIADGLITIPLEEEPDEADFEILKEIDGTADQLELQKEQIETQKKIQAQKPSVGTNQGGKGLNKQRNVRGGKLESVQGKEPVSAEAGGQGEIKSSLDTFLSSNFEIIKSRINKPRIKKITKFALKELYETLSIAKEAQTDFVTWKSEYISSLFENDLNIESQLKQFSEYIKNDDWWKLDFDTAELAYILEAIYDKGYQKAANDFHEEKYINGLVDTPENSVVYNSGVDLFEYSEKLAELINNITEFYIKTLSFAVVAESFDSYQNNLNDMLENEEYANMLYESFVNNLQEIITVRIANIREIEEQKIFNSGYTDGYNYQKGLENVS